VCAIGEKFAPLQDMPQLGAAREQLAAGLRVIFHGRYAIYYAPRENELVIVRVIHGARDAAALAEQGGFEE
jgi:toxin ParE1/3/4